MIDIAVLEGFLGAHLARQRWFAGKEELVPTCKVTSFEVLLGGSPSLLRVLVEASQDGLEGEPVLYHLVIGVRPTGGYEEFLGGHPEALIAVDVETEIGAATLYDATADPELVVALATSVVPDIHIDRARLVNTDSTHTSIVLDERLIMKLFRQLGDGGRNPDAEVTRALTQVGFANVAKPVAEWRDSTNDYAVVSEFLVGGADGFSLALTSLRDLYDCRCDPEEAGGDFAPDARRLGIVTAKLHLALRDVFSAKPGDAGAWASVMEERYSHASLPGIDPPLVMAVFERLRSVLRAGSAIRSHGDYHLGQVMRTDAGWFVLDFEGEPGSSLEDRRRFSSPLRDVAGMIRSFHYVAQVALRERAESIDERIVSLSSAWERRSRYAFLEGYFAVDEVGSMLPPGELDQDVVLTAFELDKAIYEVGYEQTHRPDWVGIPLAAVARIVGSV